MLSCNSTERAESMDGMFRMVVVVHIRCIDGDDSELVDKIHSFRSHPVPNVMNADVGGIIHHIHRAQRRGLTARR